MSLIHPEAHEGENLVATKYRGGSRTHLSPDRDKGKMPLENTGVGGPDFTQVTRFNEGYLCLCKNWDGHLMRRVNSLEKTLMLGGIGGRRRRGRQRMRWLDGITGLACCDSWGHKELYTTE